MKSEIFTSAWKIFRTTGKSFSQSLSEAWSAYKNGMEVIVMKANKLVKSSGLGFETVFFSTIKLVAKEIKAVSVNNEGAKFDYGFGLYNGD